MSTDLDQHARPPHPETEPDLGADAAVRRRRVAAVVIPAVLLIVAGVLRFYLLSHPERIYFDEVYYVEDARQLLAVGVEQEFVVHPSIGKWIIAAGMAVFGDNAMGWRAGPALMGSLTVLATYLAGLRLFRRRGLAALAGLLVATDGMALTMSRITMLDATLAFFVMIGFWLLLIDRDRQWRAVPDTPSPSPIPVPPRGHAYRWLAGLAFGLALATKWSALLAIGAAGLFVLGSELAFRRRTTGRLLPGFHRIVLSGVATLLLVPTAVYVASYAGWFINYEENRRGQAQIAECEEAGGDDCTIGIAQRISSWGNEQRQIFGFHTGLDADHGYRAHPATWPWMLRPVPYYFESCPDDADAAECEVASGNAAEVLGMGNPIFWWLASAAYLLAAVMIVWRRAWVPAAIMVFVLGQYVPWLVADRPLFLFYMTPVVPFMALILAWAAGLAGRFRYARWVPAAVAVAAVAGFAYFYPVFVGLEISYEAWYQRMWSDEWI